MVDTISPDLIIFDTSTGSDQIASYLASGHQNSPQIPVIIIGCGKSPHESEHFINLGAHDYINGQSDHNRLGQVINSIKNSQNTPDAEYYSTACPAAVQIVGKSPAVEQSLRMVNLVAQSSCNPVLIVGETGTGKELAAQAVHTLRHGANSKCVAINCAALTANLLESELFGHVKGSFTGADREKTGLLELASNGSIFLDEISEMPIDLQAKLLRVLQERTFRKVGGVTDIKTNATIIVSSNRNLLKEVDRGKFRRDLYYRLTICPINLAPLRSDDRRMDIPLLADYFIKNSTICPDKTGKIKGMTKLAAETLTNHHWPGNVRELKNVIDRAILLETTDKIGMRNLLINPDDITCLQGNHVGTGLKDFSLEKAEKELIAKALNESNWQKTKAASLLGITRATLYAKVKQYNIQQVPQQPAPVLTA
jgi:DNA-binding NtrC family response regulator